MASNSEKEIKSEKKANDLFNQVSDFLVYEIEYFIEYSFNLFLQTFLTNGFKIWKISRRQH